MPRFFLIAGEPSGDLLGAALIRGLRQLCESDLTLDGVGGAAMAAAGMPSRFPMEELSVMGLAEVLPRVPAILARVRQTSQAVISVRPDALITIDSPDFCLRVARRARTAYPQLRVVHYVAPSVWAWRAGRANKMARHVDHVLALLPFEPPLMRAAGMTCDFVGHPVVSEPQATSEEIAAIRASLRPASRLLVVLPGSRSGEVRWLAPVFNAVIRRLRDTDPGLAVVVPAAAPVADLTKAMMPADAQGWPQILDPRDMTAPDAEARKRAAFAAGDAALAASGTVSLELAAAGTPVVIAYAANAVSAWLIRRLVKVETVTLVNLVTDTRAVPEFLFENCRPAAIAAAVSRLLNDPEAAVEQRHAADRAMVALGRGGEDPGLRAARSVLAAIGS